MEKEIRFAGEKPEIRKNKEGEKTRTIEGYAIVFDKESRNLGGFVEIIKKGALDGANMDEVVARTNHDNNLLLGRTPGTLKLKVDKRGLKYSLEAPNTTAGNDTLEYIERGDISGSSFAFTTEEDKWEEHEDGRTVRTVSKIDKLFDVSPVVTPAYNDTTVAKRSLEDFEKSKEPEVNHEIENRELEIKLIRTRNGIEPIQVSK